MRKSLLTLTLALLLGAGFCYGLARLFVSRYEAGDVYPPYSSLRADPLGVKAIYDALDELPGLEARRNFRPLPRLQPAGSITLVYAGVSQHAMWEERELLEFSTRVLGGSRAVFTFSPVERAPAADDKKGGEKLDPARKEKPPEKLRDAKKSEPNKPRNAPGANRDKQPPEKSQNGRDNPASDEDEPEKSELLAFDEVAPRWGFSFDYLPAGKTENRRAILNDPASALEREISWHTALCFKDLKPEWKVIYACENKPVVIARNFGSGSIVLAADSFFLSNEALRAERRPRLLAWIFNGPRSVVFDEEHHGVREDLGIASLARKYRLHGVAAGLALLAALFVWKHSVRFIPPHKSRATHEPVAGKEAAQGFANLLRRTIRPAEILEVCVAEWRKTFPHHAREQAKIDAFLAEEKLRAAKRRNPVAVYRAIVEAVSGRQ